MLDLRPWVAPLMALLGGLAGCGAGPGPVAPAKVTPAPTAGRAWEPPNLTGICDENGQPEQRALPSRFTGLAKAAECRRALLTIMQSVSRSLGVPCTHCHLAGDFAADTHDKQVANWMARELLPQLRKRGTSDASTSVWCYDCHDGKPRLLGEPRSRQIAIDWMTTQLVEKFESPTGTPPKCRDCHGGDLGAAEFHPRIVLTSLTRLPATPAPLEPPLAPAPGGDGP